MTSKRLFLIFHGRFPGEKAAAVFTAKTAEAFSDRGFTMTVLAPRRIARKTQTPKEFYGVKENFKVSYIPIIDLFEFPVFRKIAFLASYITFSIGTFAYLLFKARRDNVIYSNEALPLFLSSFFFPKTFYEVHDFPSNSFVNKNLLSRVCGIIATNRWKEQELVRRFGINPDRVLCEPNAVDTFRFGEAKGIAVRQKLPLPTGTVLLGYAGTLKTMGMEKGIELLLRALALLPERFRCLVIGGLRDDIKTYQKLAENLGIQNRVVFAGWMHYDSIPEHLAACDVLVAPFPKTPHYDLYMSPMKLFEYMAIGKPIVATRLRTIEEIVDDSSAFLVAPDDPKAFADGILAASFDVSAKEKVARARNYVQDHTWQKRAARILDFIQKK